MSLLRVTAQRTPAFARAFSASTARNDLIKDLYIKELKAYKAPAKAADAHTQHVRSFAAPSAPKAPELPSDLAGEMSKFDSTEPTLGNSATPAKPALGQSAGGAKEFLEALESDLPKKDAH